MLKCDFNKVALQITLRHGCFHVNLRHVFRTPFLRTLAKGCFLHLNVFITNYEKANIKPKAPLSIDLFIN